MIFRKKKQKLPDDRFEVVEAVEVSPNRYRVTTVSERFGEVTQTISTFSKEVLDEIDRFNNQRRIMSGLLVSGKGNFTPPSAE